jgi:hypothetical protein
MVSFSNIPYSEALKAADEQDELLERMLRIPGIESNWDRPAVHDLFKDWRNQTSA